MCLYVSAFFESAGKTYKYLTKTYCSFTETLLFDEPFEADVFEEDAKFFFRVFVKRGPSFSATKEEETDILIAQASVPYSDFASLKEGPLDVQLSNETEL